MFKDTHAYSGFAVDDVDRAREFYGETLGIETEVLDADRPTLVYAKPDFAPATYTILNFPVPDVEATVDALAERGVAFERYEGFDQDEKGIAHGPGPTIAWFRDPAGNILSVHSEQQ